MAVMNNNTSGGIQKITPFLWFDKEADEAAKFYTSIFKDSEIKDSTTIENTPSGTTEIISIKLFGQEFNLISAGPYFKFTEAISFVVNCETQEEIDDYWEKLSAGGHKDQCGWLKDKYGLSWQIVPTALTRLISGDRKNRIES